MTGKERLKEIEENTEDTSYTWFGDAGRDSFKVERIELFKDDYDWLKEQVELHHATNQQIEQNLADLQITLQKMNTGRWGENIIENANNLIKQ